MKPNGYYASLWRVFSALFALAVFIICARYLAASFEWKAIWSVLRKVRLAWLLFAGSGSILVFWAIRAARWQLLIRSMNIRIGFADLYLCTAISLSFTLITPLSSGEAIKVELLKKYGMVGRYEGYSSYLLERTLDLLVVVLIACVSLLSTLDLLAKRSYAYWVAALGLFVVLGTALVVSRVRLPGRAGRLQDCLLLCISDWKTLCSVVALTLAGWCMVAFSWQVFLHSIGINLGYAKAMALMSVVALVSILSLIPGGLGVSEAGVAQILSRFGYSEVMAQSGALIIRSYTIFAIVIGVCHLVLWRLISVHRRLAARSVDEAI